MKITETVYALDSTKGSFAYIILGREIILIDTCFPGRGKAILKELETISIKPGDIRYILITHNDVDHIGNLAFLQRETGAQVWASKVDIPYITGELKRPGIKKFISSIMKIEIPKNINAFNENQRFEDMLIIDTPGHTPGHVCFIYKDILFAGDLVVGFEGKLKPSPDFMTWDKHVLMESIKKVAGYSFKWVCPAHGKPVERKDLWEKLI